MQTFEAWFADLLGQRELEVHRLLDDRHAIRFLIAWSMFESQCFTDSASEDEIYRLCARIINEDFEIESITEAVGHFHERYQNATRLRHLLHGRNGGRLRSLLAAPVMALSPTERTFLVLFVVFRFRNNIFHGNKGVQTWLQYGEQIRLCTEALQSVLSHVRRTKQRAAA